MRKQQKIWQQEHQQGNTLPTIANLEPSSSVVYFLEYLHKHNVTSSGNIVDIGCGKGSNSVYFAQRGYDVYALDYIQEAITKTKAFASDADVASKVHTFLTEIDKQWPFADNFFECALDCYSSIDIETRNGREIYKKELFRTLKPHGYALITVVSAEDEIEKELIKNNPGSEPNSAIWPSGKFQKDYTKEELLEFYNDFTICDLKEINKRKFKLGKEYNAQNFWLILRKRR